MRITANPHFQFSNNTIMKEGFNVITTVLMKRPIILSGKNIVFEGFWPSNYLSKCS